MVLNSEDTAKFEYMLKLANDKFNYPINKFMIYNNKFCSHCINLYNLLTQVFVGFVNVSNDQESDINVTELNNVEEEKPVLNPSPKICETVQTVKGVKK